MPHGLSQFATDLTKIVAGTDLFQREVMEKACVIVETEAKRVIGTYDYDWAPLAETTKAERARLGFPEDEPLRALAKCGIRLSIASRRKA
jgi:hypothetical protein